MIKILSLPLAVTVTLILLTLLLPYSSWAEQPNKGLMQSNAEYIGSQSCESCHKEAYQDWLSSDHQKAMQHATPKNILGNFDNQTLEYFGFSYRFFQQEGNYYIYADGPDGVAANFRVLYTFGVDPLQQYLVELSGGRLQALPVAWDSRPASIGGQRWFHLYPKQKINPQDELHWSGINQNWNFMCADCHSTNLEKNYDPSSNSFATRWSEISVGCEACHGAGSEHLKWTSLSETQKAQQSNKGLSVSLQNWKPERWRKTAEAKTAHLTSPTEAAQSELDICARCHSRRVSFASDVLSESFEDKHSMRLLEMRLYHSDGQIKDEVFEYGSFLQSRMFQQGVTCNDCHQPHTSKLRSPGASVCSQCHNPKIFDSPEHNFHPLVEKSSDQRSPNCLDCHMPSTNYMVVDARRDHSMRVPRPDISVKLDTPNACQSCHQQQSNQWAANAIREWLGRDAKGLQNFSTAINSGRLGTIDAGDSLSELLKDKSQPAIAHASAISLLPPYLNQSTFPLIVKALNNPNPLIRKAALAVCSTLSLSDREQLLTPLLKDPLASVRMEAARLLADVNVTLNKDDQALYAKALAEFQSAQLFNAERPNSHFNLGNLKRQLQRYEEAKAHYLDAIQREPTFSPAWINLAELYRQQGNEPLANQTITDGLAIMPKSAALLVAKGLSAIRNKQTQQALEHFDLAVQAEPDNNRYQYIYGVALQSLGYEKKALEHLNKAHQLFPADQQQLSTLLETNLRLKQFTQALEYANSLNKLAPNPELIQLIAQLKEALKQ